MRVQPWEIVSELLPVDDAPPTVTQVSGTSAYLATHERALTVFGMAWLVDRTGRYAVLPRDVEIGYQQSRAGGPWSVTSVTVTGPARSEGDGHVIGELPVQFTWGEMGRIDRPADVPGWLGEQIERWRP